MQSQAHIFKRGQQFHWRRRMRRQGLGFFDVKLSLRTTNPHTAAILGRKLSSESDTIMRDAVHNIISEEDARRWMADIIEREREKLSRLEMLRRTSSLDPEDDLVANAAYQAAWAHIARHGMHANVASGTNQRVANTLELILRDLTSDSRRLIMLREFSELTGQDVETARETLAVMDLYIQAKNEAWRAANTGDHSFLPADDGSSGANGNTPPTPTPQAEEDTQDPEASDPTLPAVVERMNRLKRTEGVEEKTLRQYVSFVALFTALTGVSDVRKIRQSHASAFRADLYKLPKSWGKSPRDATASRDEIMNRAATLPPEKVGLSIGTINRHLEHLSQIVTWAADEGMDGCPGERSRDPPGQGSVAAGAPTAV